ncbi:MAG: hypothetical protein MUO76_21965 [Anaerolineaceae bacterium]|nr:hypothetical protein [Anaerolineaceae bacterium]
MEAIPFPHPGGVTSYTSLKLLEGTDKPTDYGSGTLHLSDLVNSHPESVIALGLNVWIICRSSLRVRPSARSSLTTPGDETCGQRH